MALLWYKVKAVEEGEVCHFWSYVSQKMSLFLGLQPEIEKFCIKTCRLRMFASVVVGFPNLEPVGCGFLSEAYILGHLFIFNWLYELDMKFCLLLLAND